MKTKTKMFLSVLLSLALVLGLLPALLPGMNLTAKAAATPTYKIVVTSLSSNKTYSENIELPQTFTAASLWSYMNFDAHSSLIISGYLFVQSDKSFKGYISFTELS